MSVEERIAAFYKTGNSVVTLNEEKFQSLALKARNENPWFTEDSIRMAVSGLQRILSHNALNTWTSGYNLNVPARKIAVVMAGNIPFVGFHDLLCVLICGHSICIKSSSKDSTLIHFIVDTLTEIEPRFKNRIEFSDQLKNFDSIIATGSDNTSRYFEYYFGKYPHIIRKNRTSVAILNGHETESELIDLGIDVFSYFGLGCRNVSKLYIPQEYPVENVLRNWESFKEIIHHHKYCNNYDYQKSVLLVTGAQFLDNGFVMLQETEKLVSPIAVLYYQRYKSTDDLTEILEANKQKIQCVVDNSDKSKIKFGQAQYPLPGDYADQIDTLKFLTGLN